jgi:hypothetical protein
MTLIDRRAFITMAGGSILATPLVAETQKAARLSRVGSLSTAVGAQSTIRPLLSESLQALGYVEGSVLLELDGGVEGDRVWMTCTCGAVINRDSDGD